MQQVHNNLKLILLSFILFFYFGVTQTEAQVGINADGSAPNESAMLDITSSDKGILIPRMTTTEREAISNLATGLMVYDSNENTFWYYNGTVWTAIGSGAFISNNGMTTSNNNDDDFIFGADSLNHGLEEEFKLFFDKSKGAFRAGTVDNNSWDEDNLGNHSFAAGENTIANGTFATAFGNASEATGYAATALGNSNEASGYSSTSFGRFNVAEGSSATAFGAYTEAQGGVSTAFGDRTTAYSYGETALGVYNTAYNPNLTTVFHANDRLLVLGNGTDDDNRSDALVIYKSGKTELNGSLTINSSYTFPTVDGAISQVMTTDGAGALSWTDLGTTSLTDADSDTKIQVEESTNEDIIRFDLGGTEFMRLNNGRVEILNTGNSVFIGEGAGEEDDYSNNNNVFIGFNTGRVNTTGNYNIFNGYSAGRYNISGQRNIYLGAWAGENNETGDDNVFVGYETGYSNEGGSDNVFLGNAAGNSSETGENNTYLGTNAGYNNVNGTNNVFLGYETGYNETGSNKLYIDNSNSSSPLLYGEFDNDLLQINGTLNISGNYEFPTTDGSTSQVLTTNGSGILSWNDINENLGNHTATQNLKLNDNWLSNDGDNEGITIDDDGNVGIGISPTNGTLEIDGTGLNSFSLSDIGYLDTGGAGTGTYTGKFAVYANGRIGATAFIAHSDQRIKNIQGISNSEEDLSTLTNIEITNYTLKDSISNGNQSTKKVIAQQVKTVYPQAVSAHTTEVIPNIYQTARMDAKGWVNLSTDLQIGDKVQIIFKNKKELLEVLDIKDNAFQVKFSNVHHPPSTIFVYGRQVDDFHTVDYEAISMLNVSATQQLAKEIEQLKIENEQLKKEVAKINQLEIMLQKLQTKINTTTSVNAVFEK